MILLAITIIADIYLFASGDGSFSIKYTLFSKHAFFRKHPTLCLFVDALYKFFFALPFLLLLVIAIYQAVDEPISFLTYMVNGLIILLIINPTKEMHFYYKQVGLWLLAITSQLVTLFLRIDL
jgi:hypothetical protein